MDNLKFVGTFVCHVTTGCALFLLILLPALGLSFLSDWMSQIDSLYHVYIGTYILAHFLYILDFVCFVTYCAAETQKLLRGIAVSAGWLQP